MITKHETTALHSPNKRYILHETLGKGGMGVVYRATDRLNGEEVALKQVCLPPEQLDFMSLMSRSALMTTQSLRLALAKEFQTLATLRHPHIISVLDYGFGQDGQPYFTMTLLEAPQTIIEAAQDLDLAGKIGLIEQMLQALAYLHRRGILHRDVKPSNVLVSEGKVRVLDFGLSTAKEEAQSSSGGTFAYMAPELLLGQSASSEASDLYAVGIIAYELLVGRHPFDQNSEQFLDQVLNQAPDLSALDAPLAEVIGTLLKKKPQERYSSAEASLAALSEALGQPAPAESVAIRESYLQAAKFVGREREMATLTEALQEAQAGNGSAWLIGGESGVGKSRLLDELRIQALVKGFFVLRGQAVSDGGSLFQLWQPILRALLLSEAYEDHLVSILKPLLHDIESLLERPIPDAPALGGQAAQQRLLRTIATLFEQQSRPILLLLEDLHWAGDSLLILKHLQQIVGQLPLMIVATYRDDEAPHLSGQLPAMQSLKLARLSERETATLTASMLGEVGQQASFLAFLQKETEGNTFFLVEVLRALAEEAGGLTNIDPQALPAHLFPQGIQSIMQQRLARVPREAVRMLEVAAVIGRQVEMNLLAQLLPQSNLEAWLQRCADVSVFEVHEGAWRFAHDKVREAILADLTPQQAQEDHRLVAQTIETLYPEQPAHFGRLVYHWHVAQDQPKEQHYANLAGTHAYKQYAYHEAQPYLKRALSLTAADEFETRYTLLIKLQDVHLILGHAQAREQDLMALKVLTDGLVDHPNFEPKQVAEWQAHTALHRAHHFQYRNIAQAQTIAEEGLSVVQQTDSTYLEITLGLQLAHAYINQALYPLAQAQIESTLHLVRIRQDADLRFEGFSLYYLGLLYLARGELRLAKEALEQAWQILQEHNQKVTYPITLMILGKIEQASENDEQAKAHFEQALFLAREIDHQEYEAQALSALGKIAWQREAYDESEHLLRQALSMGEETENKELLITVSLRLGDLLSSRGDNEQAKTFFSLALKESQVLKWPSLVSEALAGMSHLAHRQGQLEEALSYSRQALAITQKFGMRLLQLDVLMGLGEVLRDYGESQEALTHYTDALTLCQALGKARQAQVAQAAIRKLTQAPSPKRAAAQPEAQEKMIDKITDKITMPDLETLLTDTLAQAIQQVGAERGVIVLRQKDGKERITKSVQYGEDPISRTIINQVIQRNKGLVIRNAMTDRHFARAKSVMQARIRSVLCVPLRENEQAIGAIYLEHRSKRGKFSPQDLSTLERFGQQVAKAMAKR